MRFVIWNKLKKLSGTVDAHILELQLNGLLYLYVPSFPLLTRLV